MVNFNNEQLEKAKQAKSVEELLELAKANKVEMTEDEAKAYYAQLHPTSGELADDELENVAGGGCGQQHKNDYPPDGTLVTCVRHICPMCGGKQGIFRRDSHKQWLVHCANGCTYPTGFGNSVCDVIEWGDFSEDPADKITW